MATILQLSAKVDTLLNAISNKLSKKLNATAQAIDSAKVAGLTVQQLVDQAVTKAMSELAHVNGRPGEALFFSQEGVPMAIVPGELLAKVRMASTQASLDTLKSSSVSFSTVFDKWKRISHANNLIFPAIESELSGWAYDAATDKVSSTINSSSLIGLISTDRFDSYTFETILKSTASDDDAIGLCLAFKTVGVREYTLTAMVDGGGLTPTAISNDSVPKLTVMVNYTQGEANGLQVLYSQPLGYIKQGWNATDLKDGIRLKAVRDVTGTLTVECLKADGSALPNVVRWVGQVPDLFLGKCAIGYMAHSQTESSWTNIRVPTAKTDIIDARDMSVWRWTGTTWVNSGSVSDGKTLTPGRLYKNTEGPDYGAYYLDHEGAFIKLGMPGSV